MSWQSDVIAFPPSLLKVPGTAADRADLSTLMQAARNSDPRHQTPENTDVRRCLPSLPIMALTFCALFPVAELHMETVRFVSYLWGPKGALLTHDFYGPLFHREAKSRNISCYFRQFGP